MEVASSSSSTSPPPPSKPSFRLRLNPAAFLLRPVSPSPTPPPPAPTPSSSSSATPPKHPSTGGTTTNPLIAFLSSILPITTPRTTTTTTTRRSSSGSSPIAELRKAAAADAEAELQLAGCAVPLFRPYVARLPWHGGTRAWLSKLFPRYGHYCGPNWSSGKEAGSVLWDRRPADHLDFCCYCHDMAYDTHDQAQLLRADLAFLRCLQGSRTTPALDGAAAAAVYRSMCIFGLKVILIPYRTNLVRLQKGPNYGDVFADFVKRMASSSGRPTTGGGEKQRL
ncbi:mucin-2 [Brachypodium distachyon]|uniref:Phospholipase A2 domain-containing protein n=1 Tax=Brachypodium distachyon TaxID=15368 RepID=A0A0Q3JS51_BRADI|nr:mucin-2 [Brachypodium distachyon]KQK14868.1 hypothetical protein BRADI_1g19130v3 [Brachypodium distachyon]|eukprot:XP_003562533.1 mucin-2 [Brachypodium distachyon]